MSDGPAWLGIGAMRSGTTFFSTCLTQHSRVGFSNRNARKEQRRLHQLGRRPRADERYLAGFRDPDVIRGEFSPRYLWLPQAALNAAETVDRTVPIFVLLRNPLDRYESHQRLAMWRREKNYSFDDRWRPPFAHALGQHIGNYSDHLRLWSKRVGEDRVKIFGFEDLVTDPTPIVHRAWSTLGLESEPFNAKKANQFSVPTKLTWDWPPGLQSYLVDIYARQIEELRRDWGFDASQWASAWASI